MSAVDRFTRQCAMRHVTATVITPDLRRPLEAVGSFAREREGRRLRFDRIVMTSVFGDPLDQRTWSGAPFNLARALARQGVAVEAISPSVGTVAKLAFAARHLASGFGGLKTTEQILRGAAARRLHAKAIAQQVARCDVHHVLHTGTLDLPALDLLRGVKHYLYCDQTWALSLTHRPDASVYSARACVEFDRLERDSVRGLAHIFTFGAYVRDNLIAHYGVSPDRVTAVGSGMGAIDPYFGPKRFDRPSLLFVAKHLFKAKGGALLVDAFLAAQAQRPDLTLTIVGDERSRAFVPDHPNIVFRAHLPREELQDLFRRVTLLVQPMLNDPWGQVYLEALASRTPVLGLNRNGLPEIVCGGAYGFLVDRPEPGPLSEAILSALRDPGRLAVMAVEGQRHVINTYSWERVAERVALA
jgi:glycosyltransferase involved in cell wall biosynthesis